MIRFSAFDFDTRRAISWGTTWALAVAVCEALSMAPERFVSPQLLLWWMIYWLLPVWCVIGALMLWLLHRGERLAGWRGMVAAFLVPIPLAAWLQPLCSRYLTSLSAQVLPALYTFTNDLSAMPPQEQRSDLGFYNLWVYLFYGGLLTAVYILTLRKERFRSRLHASDMARGRTEALLDAERLRALQAQVDPHLLLESMRELEQRYRSDPERAERLLEALVEFLRYAMHGLRVPVSTLEAEIRLAQAFAQLQLERGVTGPWRIDDAGIGSAGNYKFPSLLMLRLLALGGCGGRPLLRLRAEPNDVLLQLLGFTETLSDELHQQLQAGLRTLYGSAFKLTYSMSSPTQLSIALSSHLAQPGDQHV